MRGAIREIVYDLSGYPKGTSGEAEWREAISRGELRRETIVVVYREGGEPHSLSAGEVPELTPLFEERDASVADGQAEDGSGAGGADEGLKAARPPRRRQPRGGRRKWLWDGDVDPHAIEDVTTDVVGWSVDGGRAILLGVLLAVLVGFSIALLPIRPDPVSRSSPRWYRVVAAADIRKSPSADAQPVKMLTRNRILWGVPDETTRGKWLRIARGLYAGFYFKMENLETANVTGNELEIVD